MLPHHKYKRSPHIMRWLQDLDGLPSCPTGKEKWRSHSSIFWLLVEFMVRGIHKSASLCFLGFFFFISSAPHTTSKYFHLAAHHIKTFQMCTYHVEILSDQIRDRLCTIVWGVLHIWNILTWCAASLKHFEWGSVHTISKWQTARLKSFDVVLHVWTFTRHVLTHRPLNRYTRLPCIEVYTMHAMPCNDWGAWSWTKWPFFVVVFCFWPSRALFPRI